VRSDRVLDAIYEVEQAEATKAYLARGRHLERMTPPALEKLWTQSYRDALDPKRCPQDFRTPERVPI
jgi:hypothetical protein